MPIFGLVTSESLAAYREKDFRRRIFYEYPDGSFPVTGLLSLAPTEETVDPEFSHWEKRMIPVATKTVSQGSNKGPILNAAGADAGDPVNITVGTTYQLCVAGAGRFREGSVIMLLNATKGQGASYVNVYGRVTSIDTTSSPQRLVFKAIETTNGVDNGTTNENVGVSVIQIGTAFHEARERVVGESVEHPVKVTNYTQIFRTPFSMSRTALKNPLYYDKTGKYKDAAKEALFNHMTSLEYAFLFGRKREEPGTGQIDTTTGSGLPLRFTGGLIYFLELWESGFYMPVDAANDASPDKRIIENASGTLSEAVYDTYIERLFSRGSKRSAERLCVCGSGFLGVVNRIFKNSTQLNTRIPSTEAYGMKVVEHVTPFGQIYYKTHPLFDLDPEMRYWGFFIDVWSLKYRPLSDSDTKLLKMRQPPDADYRKDEWFTEAGVQVMFPERCMLIKNVRTPTV